MKTKITDALVSDLYERSNRIRRLLCNMYFGRHDDMETMQARFLEALDDLESLDEKIGIVGNASEPDETLHLVERDAVGGGR